MTTTPAEVTTIIRPLKAKNQLDKMISELNSSHTVLEFFPHIPVTYLIAAWNKGEIPKLKIVQVVPIYKKGDPNLSTTYRCISLLSPFSKTLKKLIIFSYLLLFRKI